MLSDEVLRRLGLPENPVGRKVKICVQRLSFEVPELCLTGTITDKDVGGEIMVLSVETDENERKVRASRLLRPIDEETQDLRRGWLVYLFGLGPGETARMARIEAA